MGNYFDDEVYADGNEEYAEYFSKYLINQRSKKDKNTEDTISKYDKYGQDMSK